MTPLRGGGGTSTGRRLWRRAQGLPAATAVLALVAAAAVARSTRGRYVGDNRFDQYWAPGWRLLRETSLWDGTRGMGRVGEELWPLTAPLALLRGLGLSPTATQQVWHATVLFLAALGVVVLLRSFQPRVGVTHVVAGLAYAFSPYAAIFFLPTNLFWSYALAPWLLAVGLQGLRSPHPWRWAAVWALLVATGGDTDPPGLLLAAVWIVPAAVFVVAVERTATLRHAARWLAAAAALAAWVDAAALVKVRLGSGPLAQRLLTTEGVAEVNQTSSWSESWRGLGYWVSYYGAPGRDRDVPGALAFFESLPGALLTFVVPVVALVALWRLRWRLRLLWAGLMVVALAVMVGSSPTPSRSPLGRALLSAYDAVPSLASFRTTFKAGSGLLLGIALLAATGASAWGAALARRDARLRTVPLAVLAAVVVATAIPFWSGDLYAEDRQVEAIAPHWREATAWIEAQPGDARVLVLPGSTQTAYRWGWAGDDVLDSLLRRHPNVVPTNFPVSTPLTADIVDALARRLEEGSLTAGQLATVARRLGVGWVLLRNDLDWERLRVPRPAVLDPLRDSDDLPLARAFGAPGTDTTDPDDESRQSERERELPPIEVLRVPGVDGTQPLARSAAPPLLIDGGGDAWPVLAGLGLLDGDRALRFAAQAPDDLAAALAAGSPLVVTDTNRRRLTLIRGPGPTASEVLTAEADPGPVAPADLFATPGSQTVARYGDATAIEASGFAGDLGGFAPWFRPALAFDRDVTTSWRTGAQRDPEGETLTLELAEPTRIARLALVPLRAAAEQRRITEVEVDLGGRRQRVELQPEGRTQVVLDAPVTTDSVAIRITRVEGDGDGAVGLAEVDIPDVDARERLALPAHVTGSDDEAVRAALADAPLAFVLERSGVARTVETTRHEEERVLRRILEVDSDRTFAVTGHVAGGRDLTDQATDALLGGAVGAWGTSRAGLPGEARGGLALDGDPETGWAAPATEGEQLNVRFPTRDVATVRVRVGGGAGDVPLDRLLVVLGEGRLPEPLALVPDPQCTAAPCDRVGELAVDAGAIDGFALRIADTVAGSRRARILEVEAVGADGALPRADLRVGEEGGCGAGVVTVDGEALGLRIDGPDESVLDLLDTATVPVTTCEPLDLPAGEHEVVATAGARVDQLVLATPGALDVPGASAVTGHAVERGPGRLDVALTGDAAAVVTSGQSYDTGWTAHLDGIDLGAPFEADGQSAWRVPAGADRRVELAFAPQRTYRAALLVSLAGVLACLALVVAPSRRGYRRPDGGPPDPDPDSDGTP